MEVLWQTWKIDAFKEKFISSYSSSCLSIYIYPFSGLFGFRFGFLGLTFCFWNLFLSGFCFFIVVFERKNWGKQYFVCHIYKWMLEKTTFSSLFFFVKKIFGLSKTLNHFSPCLGNFLDCGTLMLSCFSTSREACTNNQERYISTQNHHRNYKLYKVIWQFSNILLFSYIYPCCWMLRLFLYIALFCSSLTVPCFRKSFWSFLEWRILITYFLGCAFSLFITFVFVRFVIIWCINLLLINIITCHMRC